MPNNPWNRKANRPSPDEDAVSELAELLVVMRRQTDATQTALDRVQHNRFNLLVVHALTAILISCLLMASAPTLTGPAWNALNRIPGFPYTFAGVLCLGGLLLLPASIARLARMEFYGLTLIYLWYLALALGFAIPSFRWTVEGVFHLFRGDPIRAERPALYAWVVYLHLAVIMRVHMWTLRQIGRRRSAAVKAVALSQHDHDLEIARLNQKAPLDGDA
jgi:hypothetical protein